MPATQNQSLDQVLQNPKLRRQLNQLAEDIRNTIHQSELRLGNLLNEAKSLIPRGGFERWVKDTLKMVPRTARRYMTYANEVQKLSAANPDIDFSQMNQNTLRTLQAAKNETRITVLEGMRNGETYNSVEIEKMAGEQTFDLEAFSQNWSLQIGNGITLEPKFECRGKKIFLIAEIGEEADLIKEALIAIRDRLTVVEPLDDEPDCPEPEIELPEPTIEKSTEPATGVQFQYIGIQETYPTLLPSW